VIRALIAANGGYFEFDLASGAEPTRIGAIRLTKEDDSLESSWNSDDYSINKSKLEQPVVEGSAWLNPPFSKNKAFAKKIDKTLKEGLFDYIIFICQANATGDNWFENHITPHIDYLCLPDDRLEYTNTGSNPSFQSAIFCLGSTPRPIIGYFQKKGNCFELREDEGVKSDIYEFIKNAQKADDSPKLVSRSIRDGELPLNNLNRGDQILPTISDSARWYDGKLSGEEITLNTYAIDQEKNGRFEIICNLPASEGPFSQDAFFVLEVNQTEPGFFDVCYQVGDDLHWDPLPVIDIRTVTDEIPWE
jgi:hypothetical protein